MSARLAITTFQASFTPTHFPPAAPTLDAGTMFLVVTTMATLRGVRANAASALTLAAATSALYLAALYPVSAGATSQVMRVRGE